MVSKQEMLKKLQETDFPDNTSRKNVLRGNQTSSQNMTLGKAPAKPAFQPPTFKAGEKLSVRFYTAPNGSFPFTAFAQKKNKGKGKRTWYKATYDGKDKDGDFVLSFSFDGTTDSYNLGDPEDEKTFLKEKVGWVRGHLKSAK